MLHYPPINASNLGVTHVKVNNRMESDIFQGGKPPRIFQRRNIFGETLKGNR